jgi:hypothetical protein
LVAFKTLRRVWWMRQVVRSPGWGRPTDPAIVARPVDDEDLVGLGVAGDAGGVLPDAALDAAVGGVSRMRPVTSGASATIWSSSMTGSAAS